MNEKPSITVLYDAAEDVEKAKAEEEGKPFPLAYAQVADALEKRGHKVKAIGVTKKIHSLVALVEKDTSDVIVNLCEAIACSPQHEHNVVGLLERISYIQHEFDGAALVEEFIDGREIYVGVLGNDRPEAFPVIEWDFSKVKDSLKIAGTEAKWDRDSEGYKAPVIFPEDIPEEVVQGIQSAALTAYQALKLSGYARVDMRLRQREPTGEVAVESPSVNAKNDKKPNVKKTASTKAASVEHGNSGATHSREWDYPIIEVNPNCWLEKRSEFASAARKKGLSYPELLEKIIELALDRRPHVAL